MILPFFSNLVSPLVSITPAAVAMPDKASPIIPGKDTVVIEDLPPIQEETQPEVKIAPVPPRKPEMQGPPIPQVYGPPAPVDYGPHLPEPVTAEPVVAEQVTPFVSAFDPRALAQPTADFFEAYTAGTAGSNFLKNYREIQQSRADDEYKRLIANAQLLNALKPRAGTSEAEKLQARAGFLKGLGASQEEILQSMLRGNSTTINLGGNEMTKASASRFSDHVGGIDTAVTTLAPIMGSVSRVKSAMQSGAFKTGGGRIGDVLTRFSINIGLSNKDLARNVAEFDNVLATHLKTIIDSLNTGPMSDADRRYYEARTVNLGDSVEGNIRRLEILEEIYNDNLELQNFANKLFIDPVTRADPAQANIALMKERDRILSRRQSNANSDQTGKTYELNGVTYKLRRKGG